MRRFLVLAGVMLAAAWPARAATVPLYVNEFDVSVPYSTTAAPQIDATTFINNALFDINDFGFSGLPYQILNNRFVTNETGGNMIGSPGYRFDYFNPNQNVRRMMHTYVNLGTNFGTKWLLISATNIISSGRLGAGPSGLVRINGRNVSLERNGIRTGNPPGVFLGDGFIFGTNYVNPVGVTDLYWAAGTNNVLSGAGQRMRLDNNNGLPPDFNLPNPQSPQHAVAQLFFGRPYTNFVTLPQFNFVSTSNGFNLAGMAAYAYTNDVGPTSRVVQIVFVTTNNPDPTLTTDVRFSPNGNNGGADVFVEFAFSDYDIVDQVTNTQTFYFIDRSAFATNLSLIRPLTGRTRRPATYEIARQTPFEFFYATPTNAIYTNGLIYNSDYLSNAVTVQYAAYAAQITSTAASNAVGSTTLALSDPTNLPGRVEIIADKVNLDQTRIRAESTIIIRTKNLTSNHLAQVDAPYLAYDLASVEPQLIISNLAPVGVSRVSGQIAAWTGLWNNYETNSSGVTTEIKFHVLFLDNRVQTFQPVTVTEFRVRATNLVVADRIAVSRTLLLDARTLHVTGELNLPPGNNWAATNILRLHSLTNDGFINIPGAAKYGSDRTNAYTNFVNSGTNTAGAQSIRARYFENNGGGCVAARSGVLNLDVLTANIFGAPTMITETVLPSFCLVSNAGGGFTFTNCFVTNAVTNSIGAKLSASTELSIRAGSLAMSNALFVAGVNAPGALRISVTNRLVDAGQAGINQWVTSGGFQVTRRPTVSDLRGTYLTSRSGERLIINHSWPGQDYGVSVQGYENNLGLGKLTLDVGPGSTFNFRSASNRPAALYVDYLELKNRGTNYNEPLVFNIDPNLTIYFANANVAAEKLDGGARGRIRWVRDYTGPLSSTNIIYPSGSNYTFNLALVSSPDIDSDGDGIPNSSDPTPIFVEESVALTVAMLHNEEKGYRKAVLTWNSLAYATNFLEYKPALASPQWLTLTNFVSGGITQPVSILDDVPASGSRLYRVRVQPNRSKR